MDTVSVTVALDENVPEAEEQGEMVTVGDDEPVNEPVCEAVAVKLAVCEPVTELQAQVVGESVVVIVPELDSVCDTVAVAEAVRVTEPAFDREASGGEPELEALGVAVGVEPAVSEGAAVGLGGENGTTQDPAVAAVVFGSDQQAHAVQLSACSADGAQQQPPLHNDVVQSTAVEQASPGGLSTQKPEPAAHAMQPARAALLEQQKPPLQMPVAQSPLKMH